MRETSGRMEEIPGEEGFPAYLDSALRGLYERAGIIQSTDGRQGSLTLIGTVSPAGGNFEEPVTQSTLGTVKTFLGLSYDRAYKRFYPAIDPLLSWSRYREQLSAWFEKNLGAEWTVGVLEAEALLKRGEAVARMMQVTGEEGTSVEDYFVFQKARLLDMVYLQQDAFDAVDVSVSPERQREVFAFLLGILRHEYRLTDRGEIQALFNKITSAFKNMNYAAFASPDYKKWQQDIRALMEGA
jgi:V/A-type H+-transporting ATPase subunit A